MSDIVSRLRFTAEIAPEAQGATRLVPGARDLLNDAADEIERLQLLSHMLATHDANGVAYMLCEHPHLEEFFK